MHRNCVRPKGVPKAHQAPAGTEFTCDCGKRWRVTQNHLGRFCGCGWERIA